MSKSDISLLLRSSEGLLDDSFQRFADIRQAANGFHTGRFQRSKFLISSTFTARDDGAGVAHTLAFRRGNARDVADNRLSHVLFNVRCRFFFRAAADFTDRDDRFGLRVFPNIFRISMKLEPGIGSPPIPTQVDWPKP